MHNRTLKKSTHRDVRNMNPFEVVSGEKPDLSNLRIFGTKEKVLKAKAHSKSKVEPKV